VSVPPPGGKGMTSVTGLLGNACANTIELMQLAKKNAEMILNFWNIQVTLKII
jgi:hypothetical protein